ncbi:enhancer of mRNA-decapping protein 4-like isoform X3 [Rhopilema esculentum]|uniref:enhancer of mRNA-decapping protein 4-like isoform X3 n=1 Tax=Rhopilema esculentum TaxID=499914 RepID=UPI0031D88385
MDRHDEDSNVVQDLGTGGTESVDESLSLTASTSTMISSPGRRNLMMAVSQSLQSLDPLSLLKPVQQTIHCTGNDRESAFSIYGNNVTVYPCENDSSQTVASSKIKFSQVCKYDWEQRYYFGNLIASTTKYVAYVVGGKTENEHVRVINHITSSRVLLKGFEGKVMCLAFGGPTEDHIACMDIVGNLRIFLISEGSQGLDSELVLEVLRNETQLTEYSFVSWAPNLPEDDSEDEGESELVVAITYREKTDVLNVTTIKKIHGSSCSLQDIKNGRQSIHDGHKEPITQLAISPNYEVLATSSLDGYVKMWNINFESEADPSCVHEWLPHDGKPVTGLFFCDNLLSQEENMLSWRFLITGAEFNSEIKVWCSVSWKCLQTVKFSPHPSSSPSDSKNPHPRLKAVLDKSAVFFILSDIRRQVLYVLQLHQNSQEGAAHFTSLTECLLAQPLLCFSVHYTKTIKKRKQEDEIDGDNADGDEDDNEHNDRDENGIEEDADDDYNNSDALASTGSSAYQVSLKMFGIHVKSLDKLHIKYTPTCSVPPVALSECTAVSSEDFMSIRDGMSDITGEQGSVVSDQEDNDSFATAALKISALEESIKSSRSSLTGVTQSTSSVSQATDYENASIHVDQSEGQDTKEEQVDESTKEEEKELSREEKDTVSPEEEQKSSIKQGVETAKEEEPVPVDSSSTELSEAMPSDEKDSEDGARLKKATQMSSSSSLDLNPSKPRKGIITILERPKGLEGEKAMTGNASAGHWNEIKPVSDNELARRQLMADLGIVSPNKSGSPKSGKENKRVLSNRGSSRMPADSVTEKSTGSSSDSSMTIKTGDLLGLGLNGDASSDVRMSAVDAPENSKQMETILKTLQDQEKMMVQMSRRVQELTATLEQQMKRNERLESQRLAEKESMKAALQQIQKNSAPNFNKAVKEITKACSQRIDLLTSTMQTDMKHAQERQMLALLEGVNTAVTGKIEKCLKAEFRSNLLPNFQRPITLAMEQVTSQVSSRLAAMEKTFREEVEAMVASKQAVVESLEFSATAVLENTLPNAYRNAFEKVLIPSFEDSCRQMFLQISREFEKGTRSHFERMESYFDSRKQKDLQSRDQVLKQLQGLGQTFQDTADRLTGIENNLLVVMEKQIKDLVNELKKDVVSHLDKSMHQMREELISIGGMASAKETSGYSEDPFDQLNKNIESLDYNNAFTIALNAGDLNMVLYVCQRVDAEDLFSKKGNALSQPVILSLIQQLSAELTIETDLKVNYLSEAITALDQKDEITAEHMPRVLENLSIQVNNATTLLKETEPSNQFIKSLKVLRQLVKAALKGAAH